jgi:TonB family protein
MFSPQRFLLASCLGFLFAAPLFSAPQQDSPPVAAPSPQVPPPQDPAKLFNVTFPESSSGLEKLAKELIKSLQNSDTTRANALAQSMVLQDPLAWYTHVFGESTARNEGTTYLNGRNALPDQLLAFFSRAVQDHNTDVVVARFEHSCDDNAAETTFGMLQSRLEPVPLYELRLANGGHFVRLFAFVYQDGAFRFVFLPKTPPAPAPRGKSSPPASGNKDRDVGNKAGGPEALIRIRQGGNVAAAKLLNKVPPIYPEKAREERIQGTVHLHAIIGKDGNITHLRIVTGACSLAQSALDAVQKWRYSPTLLQGQPVEVDTTIDVIYSLRQ